MTRRAAIDLGSNSALLLITDADGTALVDDAVVVGLGHGLKDSGALTTHRINAAAHTLARFVAQATGLGVAPQHIQAVTTSAARRATNLTDLIGAVRAASGLTLRVLTGDEEADLTWSGTLTRPARGPTTICDLGGGSTELASGDASGLTHRVSLELGSVRMTETFFGDGPADASALARARARAKRAFASWSPPTPPRELVGVAGTVTTLVAWKLGLDRWRPEAVDGAPLSRDDLQAVIYRTAPLDAAARSGLVPIAEARAPFLLAGALILDALLERCRLHTLKASVRGLRYALVQPDADLAEPR